MKTAAKKMLSMTAAANENSSLIDPQCGRLQPTDLDAGAVELLKKLFCQDAWLMSASLTPCES